jgi:hypothetical protein
VHTCLDVVVGEVGGDEFPTMVYAQAPQLDGSRCTILRRKWSDLGIPTAIVDE